MPDERCAGPCDDGPCMRVCGRFAGEVPGVEFLEGGVDVVEVERDEGRDPFVGIDFDYEEKIDVERVGVLVAERVPDTNEDQALSTGRNDD